jgi:hypothetical protein
MSEFGFKVKIEEYRGEAVTYIIELGNLLLSVAIEGRLVHRAIYLDRNLFYSDRAMFAGRTAEEMLLTLYETRWLPHVQSVLNWAAEHGREIDDV